MSDASITPAPPALIPADDERDLQDLLPIASIPNLTEAEKAAASRLQNALHILGPAGGGALVCPGNQLATEEHHRCAYFSKCALVAAQKAPRGEICPVESEYIVFRFKAWAEELGKKASTLSASERSFVGELVWLDVQEQRCSAILSRGEAARMTQLNVKEAHPDTLAPITWERVIHVNAQLLESISVRRRILLKEWMLSPEQKAKKARWENKGKDDDQSSRQSALSARLRKIHSSNEPEAPAS